MKKKQGKIKIIGGKFKGKKILISKNNNLRPTINSMRETLFNWLNPIINGSNCLDCFTGSGALGIEAISRGANNVIMLENNYQNFFYLIKNFSNIKNYNFKLIYINTLKWLNKSRSNFDIIFIDPPFSKGPLIINKTISLLEKNNYLSNKSYIYIETYSKNNLIKIPLNWNLYKEKIKNKVLYKLYKRNNLINSYIF